MATPRKTQIEKIENVLLKYNTGAGVTADSIARLARVPREAVGKRVHDLREYYSIYTTIATSMVSAPLSIVLQKHTNNK